ncbi:MAG: glycosyltransferase [Terriglobales bacterium]
MGTSCQLLQVVHALYPQSAGEIEQYAWEIARGLGGAVLSLSPQPGTPPPAWEGLQVLTPAPGETAMATWQRALDCVQPRAVFVQHLGALSPAVLLDLRERSIPYAVFLHDFTPLCPTHHLWHRSEENCSGPGATGWKCAWCISGDLRRVAELPLRMMLYRHRPQDWRTALVRAEALVTSSRFARDFWIGQGGPPERITVVAPRLGLDDGPRPAVGVPPRRRLLFAGGPGHAGGAELLGAALDLVAEPVQLEVLGRRSEAEQLRLRAGIADRHGLTFHGQIAPAELLARLAACGTVIVPPRWQQPFSRLIADAQAAGARVVATAVGGLPEQIIHGVNGFLAAPDDAQALAEGLVEAWSQDQPAWAGERVAGNARSAGLASSDALHRLLDLMIRGVTEPDPALELEHGRWLRHQAAAEAATVLEEAQKLSLALRDPGEAEPAFASRAYATTRQRMLDLNHAVAFFRGRGCRRIANAGTQDRTALDVMGALDIWGLEMVSVHDLPDGIWVEADTVKPELLRRRFPQAKALVTSLPEGLETVAWSEDAPGE